MIAKHLTHRTIIAGCIMALCCACGTSRKGVSGDMPADTTSPVTGVSRPPASGVNSYNAGDALRSLTEGYSEWRTVEVPFKVNVDKPAKLSASGRAYMTRGRDIYISVRVMGLEVANLYVTTDSVFASEKLNRRYLAEPLAGVLSNAGLTVSDIQDLLMGRAFLPGHGTLTAGDAPLLSLSTADGRMLITPKTQPHGYEFGYLTDINANAVTTLVVEPRGRRAIECGYSHPLTVNGLGRVNNAIGINANAGRTAVDVSLEWKYDDAKTSGIKSDRWKRPKGYTRVSATQLLKMLRF